MHILMIVIFSGYFKNSVYFSLALLKSYVFAIENFEHKSTKIKVIHNLTITNILMYLLPDFQ